MAPRRPLVLAALTLLALALAVLIGMAFLRSPLVGLVLALGACVMGFALRQPSVAGFAVLFLLYSNLPAVGVAFHGVPKAVAAAFPLLLSVPLVRDLCVRREKLVWTPVLSLLVLFLALQAASALLSIDPERSFESVLTFALEGVALYLLVTNVLRSKAALRQATVALVAAGVLMSAVPLFQQVTGTFDRNYGGLAQVDNGGFETGEPSEEGGVEARQARLAGPIGEKNRYAQVMLVLLPLALSCAFRARTRGGKFVALLCTGSIALGFALAFSRGGALGMVCVLAIALGLRLIDLRKAALVAFGMALVLLAMPQYWKRLETIGETVQVLDPESGRAASDGAVRRRVTEMLAAVRVFLDHPCVGVGPGLFKSYAEEYGNQDALRRIEGGRRAHSLYLEIAAENGAAGLLLFLGALLFTITGLSAVRRAHLARDPELADLATAYLLALVAYCSTGLFLHLSYMRYFYLVLALGGAVTQVAARERREVEPSVVSGALLPATGGA